MAINIRERHDLEQAISAYGSDSARWPENLQKHAEAAKADAHLSGRLKEASHVDEALAALNDVPEYTVPHFDALPIQQKPMKPVTQLITPKRVGMGVFLALWAFGLFIVPQRNKPIQQAAIPAAVEVSTADELLDRMEGIYPAGANGDALGYVFGNLITEEFSDDDTI